MDKSLWPWGPRAVLAAVVLGAGGDALLRSTPWGLNVVIWIMALLSGMLALTGSRGLLKVPMLITMGAMLFFAGGFAWRDSTVLRGLDFIGLGVSAALLVWQRNGGKLGQSGILECVEGATLATVQTAVGLPQLLAKDIEWSGIGQAQVLRQMPAVLAGLALSVPLVVVFGGLFLAADVVYRRIIEDFVRLDVSGWLSHTAIFGVITWTAGGYLRAIALGREVPPQLCRGRRLAGVGNVELCTVLVVLNLLFLSFVIVQFRYLFGGAALVESTMGVTFAEYAREGFFQLVVVAGLVLPLLLLLDWLRQPAVSPVKFRFLALAMIVLVSVIMVSALFRMHLYKSQFGLTELRYYSTAFMLWLALILCWFILTVLRGERNRFISGAILVALAMVVGLHVVNPEASIVGGNMRQAAASGRPFDAKYAASLSTDVLPVLLSPRLPVESQAEFRDLLVRKRAANADADWRSWNWSRYRGQKILAAQRAAGFSGDLD